MYRLGDILYRRCKIGPERSKKKREMEKRADEAKRNRNSDFRSVAEVTRKVREKDEKELAGMDVEWNEINKSWQQTVEAFAAALMDKPRQGQAATAVTPAVDSASTGLDAMASIQSLEKRFTGLHKELDEHKTMLQHFQKGKEEADAKLKASDAKNRESEAMIKELNSKVQTLQQDYKQSEEKFKLLASLSGKAVAEDPDKVQRKDVVSLSKRIDSVKQAVNSLQPTVDELKRANDASNARRLAADKTLKDALANATADIAKLGHRVDGLEPRLQEQERQATGLAHLLDDAKNSVQTWEHSVERISVLERHLEGWDKSEYEDLLDTWSALNIKENFPQLQDQLEKLDNMKDNSSDLQDQLKQLNAEMQPIKGVNVNLSSVNKELREFEKVLGELKPIVYFTRDEVQAIKESEPLVAKISAEVEPVGKEVRELRTLIDTTRDELQSIKREPRPAPVVERPDLTKVNAMASTVDQLRNEILGLRHSTDTLGKGLQELVRKVDEGEKKLQDSIRDTEKKSQDSVQGTENKLQALIRKNVGDIDEKLQKTVTKFGESEDALRKFLDELTEANVESYTAIESRLTKLDGDQKPADGIIHDLENRVNALESQRIQARTPASTPRLESHRSPVVACDSTIVTRIKAIEDQHLSNQITQLSGAQDRTAKGHEHLLGQVKACGEACRDMHGKQAQDIRIAIQQIQQVQQMIEGLESSRRQDVEQIQQLQFQIQTFNAQLNHINSADMAKEIIAAVDLHMANLAPRIDSHEIQIRHLKNMVQKLAGDYHLAQHDKRSLSPRTNAEEAAKRRRLELNGYPPSAA